MERRDREKKWGSAGSKQDWVILKSKNRKLEGKAKELNTKILWYMHLWRLMLEKDSTGLDSESGYLTFMYSLTYTVYPVYDGVFIIKPLQS